MKNNTCFIFHELKFCTLIILLHKPPFFEWEKSHKLHKTEIQIRSNLKKMIDYFHPNDDLNTSFLAAYVRAVLAIMSHTLITNKNRPSLFHLQRKCSESSLPNNYYSNFIYSSSIHWCMNTSNDHLYHSEQQ